MDARIELYKAVKHQVNTYQADHGYSLREMWSLVNQDTKLGRFWRSVCLEDYREDLK